MVEWKWPRRSFPLLSVTLHTSHVRSDMRVWNWHRQTLRQVCRTKYPPGLWISSPPATRKNVCQRVSLPRHVSLSDLPGHSNGLQFSTPFPKISVKGRTPYTPLSAPPHSLPQSVYKQTLHFPLIFWPLDSSHTQTGLATNERNGLV